MRVSCLLALLPVFGWAQKPNAEILWDRYGVPHIYAKDPRSVAFAFGYAQMESHGNLILELYGQARGRAAEYWGKEYLPVDRWVRTTGIPEIAARWYTQQTAIEKTLLDGFTAGVNAYAADHRDKLDAERTAVLPVQPTDVLAHGLRVIHFSFVTRADNLEDIGRQWRSGEGSGSNAWAIGPSRSASGKAMLLANPHLPWSGYYVWYEVHLNAPGLNFYGATLVGNPSVSIGFSEVLGWTHTVNTHDGADLYELTLAPGGYRYDGAVKPFEEQKTVLRIRQPDGSFQQEDLVVRKSVHGPVVRERGGKALALRVAGLDQPHMIGQYWDMARAKNLAEWEKAESRLQMPMFTTMYADRDGHVYHLFGGRTPVRSKGDWSYWAGVVPGDTSGTLWTATHPYGDLPKWLDPPSGYLQNANDPPWTTTLPYILDRLKFPPYLTPSYMGLRPQRSMRMLEEDKSITFEEMISYKFSTRMELADRMLDELTEAAGRSGNALAKDAAQVLSAWDRCADNGSRGGVLFYEFFRNWTRSERGRIWAGPWDEKNPQSTPKGIRNPETAVKALEAAATQVKQQYGSLSVPWGDVFRLRIDDVDLPSNGATGDVGVFRVTGSEKEKDGKWKATGGDSFVAAVEFSTPVKARVVLGYGNSSQPGSSHRTDQLRLYSQKELRPAWLTRAEVEKNLERKKGF